MQQILDVWNALDARRRVIVFLATAAVFAAVLGLARMASSPSLTLLYAGLESGAAGDVVAALEQRGVAYDVRGGAIFVESARRDELRMTLASEGLPATSTKGYELLDSMSGFGTTSQMFDAAYWRAKEGELARTIQAHPAITGARVHLASTGSNPFQRDVEPSASVMINTASGALTSKHARALRYLVASAVTGLAPDDVSIIDSTGGLIGVTEDAPTNATDDRAEAMRKRVQRLLEARVGPGNAVVELSLDTVTRTESMRERRIDPQSRVAISTDSEERTNTSSDQGGGDVTVASNLPDGEAGAGDTSSSQSSETRERVNYEVSETERQITVAPGAIKRLTVAVLVNGTTTTNPDGSEAFTPRPEEELTALRDLVASAVGFDEERGDVITLKTMQFETVLPSGTGAETGFLAGLALDLMSIIQAIVLAVVALILGLFVVRPILMRTQPESPALLSSEPPETPPNEEATRVLTGEIDDGARDPSGMSLVAGPEVPQDNETDVPALTRTAEDPAERLRNLIGERQQETVEILRNWLEGEEENA
ncbi:flagellar basal-body MS-ring/collar protein FliF [uncultured Roseovarius sp.]|uniref:flagellar basal-body MS-ring/collar protein FliF n=1 Tax=uncultured Roseovarius sp. TaxID=293344 RepID=UPI0025D700AD|nr:flagellar basal-body MS-ring/collar protein FliF [uncultured Roseovarius sp.]